MPFFLIKWILNETFPFKIQGFEFITLHIMFQTL